MAVLRIGRVRRKQHEPDDQPARLHRAVRPHHLAIGIFARQRRRNLLVPVLPCQLVRHPRQRPREPLHHPAFADIERAPQMRGHRLRLRRPHRHLRVRLQHRRHRLAHPLAMAADRPAAPGRALPVQRLELPQQVIPVGAIPQPRPGRGGGFGLRDTCLRLIFLIGRHANPLRLESAPAKPHSWPMKRGDWHPPRLEGRQHWFCPSLVRITV